MEERFDLAVRVGTLPDSASLAARRLGTQRMGICAAPSYLAEHGYPSTLDELAAHDCILYAQAGQPVPWRVREGSQIREIRASSRMRFDDLQAIADAAVAGAGLAWLPCWLLSPHVHRNELTLVIDSERVLATGIHAVWPKNRHLPSKTRAAIDALATRIPAMMGYPDAKSSVAA